MEVWAVGEGARTQARPPSQFRLPQPSPLVPHPLVTLSLWSGQVWLWREQQTLGLEQNLVSLSAPLTHSLP